MSNIEDLLFGTGVYTVSDAALTCAGRRAAGGGRGQGLHVYERAGRAPRRRLACGTTALNIPLSRYGALPVKREPTDVLLFK